MREEGKEEQVGARTVTVLEVMADSDAASYFIFIFIFFYSPPHL